MKFLIPIVILLLSISQISCQKDADELLVEEQELENTLPHNKDSISFSINDTIYSSAEMNGFGFSNKQINIKPYPSVLSNREAAYSSGGYWWYGEKDSLIFEQTFTFRFADYSNLTLGISKKYLNSELLQMLNLKTPKNTEAIFSVGSQPFATDNNRENTKEGISFEYYPEDTRKVLTSFIPSISILKHSGLGNNLQDDAYFEIIRLDTLSDAAIVVEARFEANIYASKDQAYRIKDGFVRFKTKFNHLK